MDEDSSRNPFNLSETELEKVRAWRKSLRKVQGNLPNAIILPGVSEEDVYTFFGIDTENMYTDENE